MTKAASKQGQIRHDKLNKVTKSSASIAYVSSKEVFYNALDLLWPNFDYIEKSRAIQKIEIAACVLTEYAQKLLLEIEKSFTLSVEMEIVKSIKEVTFYIWAIASTIATIASPIIETIAAIASTIATVAAIASTTATVAAITTTLSRWKPW